uniref:WAT1-related protein n=1 Tax=Nelumbo nucifera TaxID=4432 RepID=A0A822YI80_NELNU|nr:TPA_asm: hypothetical protein HUJ06_011131 [Nelumbo nucifera]
MHCYFLLITNLNWNMNLNGKPWFSQGIMGSGLSFVGMSWCVKKRDPLFTSAFSPLIQIIVAIIDFFILHEKLNLGSVLGSVLVIIGLYSLVGQK